MPFPNDLSAPAGVAGPSPALPDYGMRPSARGHVLADLRCTPDRRGRRVNGAYSEFAVAFVVEGIFDYSTGAGAGLAVPGSIIFGNRSDEFVCRHLTESGNRRLVLFLSRHAIEQVAEDLSLDTACFPRAAAPPSRLSPWISAHMLRIARDQGSEESAAAIIQAGLCADGMGQGATSVSPADKRRIVGVVQYINDHYAAPCSLDALADVAGMGRFRFARRFREVTGETANQYVLSRRLTAAATRLARTDDPVLQVAYESGFNDLSYFYVRFRSVFGRAPAAWRRTARS